MLNYRLPALIMMAAYLIVILILHKKHRLSLNRHIVYSVFCLYVITVISFTFFPFPYQKSLIDSFHRNPGTQYQNNFVPLHTILRYYRDSLAYGSYMTLGKQVAGNLLMFVPLGIYLPFLKRRVTVVRALLIGFLGSLFIETLQFLLNKIIGIGYRAADVDDILLNVAGALAGFAFIKLLFYFRKKLAVLLAEEKAANLRER